MLPQGGGAAALALAERVAAEDGFQVRRGTGVVVDAAAIYHPGKRRNQIGPKPNKIT